jgi:hypothetical protein
MSLEEDWAELRLRRPVQPTGDLEEFIEDWDVLQGRHSWFVALYDDQDQRIPGTIRRTDSLDCTLTWETIPFGGIVKSVGYWSRGTVVTFVGFDPKYLHVEPGDSFSTKLKWAFSGPITFTLPSISNHTSNITFSTSTCGSNMSGPFTFTGGFT